MWIAECDCGMTPPKMPLFRIRIPIPKWLGGSRVSSSIADPSSQNLGHLHIFLLAISSLWLSVPSPSVIQLAKVRTLSLLNKRLFLFLGSGP